MAYTELVSFIREQLQAGRDVRTIRDYLLKRNMDPKAIDEAFDEVFGNASTTSSSSAVSHSHSVGKFVVVALIMLVVAFIGIGLRMYYSIPEEVIGMPIIEKPIPENPNNPIQETFVEDSVCPFEDTEEKYQCYLSKFKANEIQCHEINDYDEREFCYVAQDLYVLSA